MKKLLLLTVLLFGIGAPQAKAQCLADFQFTLGNCPQIDFFDLSSAGAGDFIQGWFWDFGDGNTSSSQNPSHTYIADGTYTVCLTIFTATACTDQICLPVTINCIGASSCSAFFQYTLGNCPQVFFADGSTSSPGSIVGWGWDFGDGNFGTGQNPTHTYTANGSYLVCLSIQTTDGCSDQYCDTIVISCIAGASCDADYTYTLGNCPDVLFVDASTASPGSVVTWDWDFGDGNFGSGQTVNHTYTANGTYSVCLTISTSDFCSDVYCSNVVISCIAGAQCAADFTYNDGNCPDVFFVDNSTASPGNVTSWSWDFGDGNVGTGQTANNTYAANGNYLVCLTIWTSDSCTSMYCDTVTVNCITSGSCQAAFGVTDNDPNFSFTDSSSSSSGTIVDWSWDFGDGNSSSLQNPSNLYTVPGTYQVCLTITTSDSCVDTYCDLIIVDSTVGIFDRQEIEASVYPNPAHDILQIEVDNHSSFGYRIMTMEGRLIDKLSNVTGNTTTVDVSSLAKGVYFLQLESDGSRKVIRFIRE